MNSRSSILILGAGLQGCSIALEIACRGHGVVIVDQDTHAMNRASLRNEGKIHLGLIYAADTSFATAELQLRGALSFQNLLSRWCGDAAFRIPLSTKFEYLVANDSIVSVDHLQTHYERLNTTYHEMLRDDRTLNYMGERPDRLYSVRSPEDASRYFNMQRFLASFQTAELAVETETMAHTVRTALLSHENIQFLPGRRVTAIHRSSTGFQVEGTSADGTWTLQSEQLVNSTWEGRFVLDQMIGVSVQPGLLHRLKYRVIAKLPPHLRAGPSATMVLGPYGDVVVRPNGTAYLSWYPSGLSGWSHEIAPPSDWDRPCRGESDPVIAQEIARNALANIEPWYPGIGESKPLNVDAGAIVAYGNTDVDDVDSGLHDRTRIGVTSVEGYHSVDPGKLTTAPLFAVQAADAILGKQDRRSSDGMKTAISPYRPHVVALMPTWNAASFLEPVLQSIAAQTYPNLSLLISDDCSSDDTVDVCERFAACHSNVRIIRQAKNLGWVGNVNALLAAAHGDMYFIAFHDDMIAPDYVTKLVAALQENPDAVMAYCDMELKYQDERKELCVYNEVNDLTAPVDRARSVAALAGKWWVPNHGLFRADAATRIGGMKRHLRGEVSADWPWLAHMSILGQFVRVPELLCFKAYTKQSLSRSWRQNFLDWCAVSLAVAREVHHSDLSLPNRLSLYGVLTKGLAERFSDLLAKRFGRKN